MHFPTSPLLFSSPFPDKYPSPTGKPYPDRYFPYSTSADIDEDFPISYRYNIHNDEYGSGSPDGFQFRHLPQKYRSG